MPLFVNTVQLENGADVTQDQDVEGLFSRNNAFFVTNPTDHFISAPSTGWTWAGAPFAGTPSSVTNDNGTSWRIGHNAVANAFMYKAFIPGLTNVIAAWDYIYPETGGYTAIRIDDGTDNNFVMGGDIPTMTGTDPRKDMYVAYRIGGGAVTAVSPFVNFPTYPQFVFQLAITGTPWTNWDATLYMRQSWSFGLWLSGVGAGLTWTPSRFGFLCASVSTAAWQTRQIDWVYYA